MTWIFVCAIGFVLYTYLVFPLVLHYLASGKKLPVAEPITDDNPLPSLSIVIAAHNERDALPAKLKSLETLDYPKDKIEWIIVSDGSSDGTADYLKAEFADYENRHCIHYEESRGKCGALNEGVANASGDVILFMDARQVVSPNAAMALVPYLADDTIGAATGELILSEDSSLEAANFGSYWRYEKWIRHNETRLTSITGVTGALYAIRRKDFIPNVIGTLLDDFETPISLLKQGKRTLYVSGAYAFDKANDDLALEFRRKVRNLAGNWQSFMKNKWLFHPKKNPVWWQFLSHKLFRLLVPFALIIAFISAFIGALSGSVFLQCMFAGQLLAYALAAASYAGLPGTRNKVLNFFKVFVQLNAAALVATVRFFTSDREISWR
jgi:cellulose synthase/poly-beta-1,6-N-acetylglucosamine synthase-like glycosyltransferase